MMPCIRCGNRTPDGELVECAVREGRIVVTKDDDFVRSFLLYGQPPRLPLIATGNIADAELESLVRANLERIETAFEGHRFLDSCARRW